MPSPILSPRRRAKIALLARYKTQRSVATMFNVSQSTVSYCVASYARTQSLPAGIPLRPRQDSPTPSRTPRPKKLDLMTLQMIKEFAEMDPFATNRQTLESLALKGVSIAPSTLRRARAILKLRRYKAIVKPFLSEAKKAARLAYAILRLKLKEEWGKVICTDECALYLDQLYQAYCTRPIGSNKLEEKYIQYAFRSGLPCLMVWGAIWLGGRSPLVRFDTSQSTGKRKGVTAAIYRTQITEGPLLVEWKRMSARWRGYGRPWVLEDNAPIHKCKKTRQKGEALGMRFLDHPASSPCLNPIENVWTILKRKLAALRPRPTSHDALFEAAQKIWMEIPQATLDRLVMSMPDRLQKVVDAKGGYIDY